MSPELACWRSGLLALQISLLYFQLPSLHWSFWFYPPRKTYTAETLALSVQRFRQGLVSITVADVWATVGVLDLIEIASISLLKMQGKTSWANRSFTHQVSEFKLSLLDRWLSMVVFIWNLEKKKTNHPTSTSHTPRCIINDLLYIKTFVASVFCSFFYIKEEHCRFWCSLPTSLENL